VRERVVKALQSRGRVSKHAGEDSCESVQADLENLRAAVRELHDAVLACRLRRQRGAAGDCRRHARRWTTTRPRTWRRRVSELEPPNDDPRIIVTRPASVPSRRLA